MDYTMDDWDRMQREAERRVRYSRERNAQKVSQAPPTTNEQESRTVIPVRRKRGGIFDLLDLNRFDLDGDRSMILMMLALLSGEEKDELLTLALLYIML